VGLRIPEVRKHTIAHVLRDETTIALDQFGAAAMINADDSVQIFGIKPR
jgi:hypothetical protein